MAERPKNGTALVYLRRSTGKQEASMSSQLRWALDAAPTFGVKTHVTQADAARLLAERKHEHGNLYLDDGITGADLDRPGFTALRKRALRDATVSHIFIHMPDRFARPEDALDAVRLQTELQKAGLTVVFSTNVGRPRRRGESNIGEDLQMYFQYHESGEFLRKLAQRVIERHVILAEAGYRTGGRPPYGFERVLVDGSDNVRQVLPEGMLVRMEGCHVRLRVNDPDKIAVWLMILNWYDGGTMGAKQLARRLNDMGIPAPDAGRTRTDNRVRHKVSGKWGHGTVLSLIKNRAIIGVSTYGVQSEGAHRRLGDAAPRYLEDRDLRDDGTPKVVNNPPERVIVGPAGYEALADVNVFERCQEKLVARGKSQRGVTRKRNPSDYPLALRVFDMSKSKGLPEGCGHPMYAKTSGSRALYLCGRYNKTAGCQCDHNAVDADATLTFVLNVLRQSVDSVGGREALREQLHKLARGCTAPAAPKVADDLQVIAQRVAGLEAEAQAIGRNLARSKDDEEMELFRAEHAAVKGQLQRLTSEYERQRAHYNDQAAADDVDAEVEAALAVYDDIEVVTKDFAARAEIPRVLEALNLRLWLNFGEGKKGKRAIRVLKGGLITTGAAELPMPLYGPDADPADAGSGGSGALPPADGETNTPSVKPNGSPDGVSLTKVHRGDRIRTCDLLTPSQAR